MARKKQSLRRSPSSGGGASISAAGQGHSYSRSQSSGADTPTPETIEAMERKIREAGREQDSYNSMSDHWKAPTLREPISWLHGLWRLYEATFAISMMETVRD